MIRTLENGIKVIELGLGTTQISQVVHKNEKESLGICFSNTIPSDGITGEEIIIEIHGQKGVNAYLIPLIEFLKTRGSEEDRVFFEKVLSEMIDAQ